MIPIIGTIPRGNLPPVTVKVDMTEERLWINSTELSLKGLTDVQQRVVVKACEQFLDENVEDEKKTLNSCSVLALITKVARESFAGQDNSYIVELDVDDKVHPLKLFVNLRKSEPDALAGSGAYKVCKVMKRIWCATDELYVRSVLKDAQNGITTEAFVFARIKMGQGVGKQHVLQGNVFEFLRKNLELGVACASKYCSRSFNDLEQNAKKKAIPAIALGIEYLHANGIVHCDINSNNILLSGDSPVIIDLEGALVFDQTTGSLDAEFVEARVEKHVHFFRECAPPEVRKIHGAAFDQVQFARAKKWDIFAFGLLTNYAYSLGIVVDNTNKSSTKKSPERPARLRGYELSISEDGNRIEDYQIYKAPLDVPDNKSLIAIVLKCLQGQDVTWEEVKGVL